MMYFLAGFFSALVPVGIVTCICLVKDGFKAGINFSLD